MTIQVVILAAGQGKRMHSRHPKVLHHLAEKPLLKHVIDTALTISPDVPPIIVYGHQGKLVSEAFPNLKLRWVEQKEQLGTGHALLQAMPLISHDQILILYGDVPLISENTLKKLIHSTPPHALGMVTAHLEHPTGYGRIIRNKQHQIVSIVEEKDATEEERKIKEINPGIYFVPTPYLKKCLPLIQNQNAQGEYYLTDLFSFAVKDGMAIHSVEPAMNEEILGVNDRVQLAHLERFYQRQQAEKLMRQGVTLRDPARFDLRGDVQIGRDVVIDINVILEGRIVIGDECHIGANSILRDVTLG